MPALFTALLLLLPYAPIFSSATEFVPTLKSAAEVQPAIIRGLFDLGKRQGYYCPSPSYTCESYYCCPNRNYQCCRDGGCCRPGTYCDLASNGKIGCCPTGRLCSGPVGDPSTTTLYYTSTRTHTSTIDIPTTHAVPKTTISSTPIGSPKSTGLPTTTPSVIVPSLAGPTLPSSRTPSSANITTTRPSAQPASTPNGIANAAIGATQNARAFLAVLTCSCMVIIMVIF